MVKPKIKIVILKIIIVLLGTSIVLLKEKNKEPLRKKSFLKA